MSTNELLCGVVLLLLLVCVTNTGCVLERETVSGSFSSSTGYSYPLDSEANESIYECGFPWGRRDSDTGKCRCGDNIHNSVYCFMDNSSSNVSLTPVGILDCSCMTWDDEKNTTVVGHCLFNCKNGSTSNRGRINRVYHTINNRSMQISPSNLTKSVCGYLNRDGRLCGKCASGFHPPAYSYSQKCVKCPNEWYNWFRFAAEAFGPLTIFLIIVLVFRISATSAQLSAYVLFSQNMTTPSNVQVILAATKSHPIGLAFIKIVVTLYSVWNLDFFRSVFPPVCLHVTTLQLILLEYCIAFYPLLLLVLIYLVAKLRMYRIRGVRLLWDPVHATMTSLRKTWNFKTSVIHSFATFLLLSYSKLLSISFHSLLFTNVHNSHGINVGRYVYSDASVKYFGSEHTLYGLLSITVFVVFVLLPVVLMFVYPIRWFQRLLTKFGLNHEVFRSFMESFQGCYKDGTNGSRDCRYFSAVYLLARIIMFLLYSITLTSLFYTFGTILFIVMAILIITVRPYKKRYAIYNKVDAIMILIQALSTSSVLCHIFADIKGERFKTFSVFLVAFFTTLPIVYIVFISLHWAYTNEELRSWGNKIRRKTFSKSQRSERKELLETDSHTKYGSTN